MTEQVKSENLPRMQEIASKAGSEWGTRVYNFCKKHGIAPMPEEQIAYWSKSFALEQILEPIGGECGARAKLLAFDYALPQQVVDAWQKDHGIDLRGEFVFMYDNGESPESRMLFGVLFPLTLEAFESVATVLGKRDRGDWSEESQPN